MRESLSKHVCPVLSPSSPPPVFQLNLFRIFSLYHALRESFSVCNVCIINTTRPAVTIGKPWKFKSKSRHWMRLRSLFSNLDLNLVDFTDEFRFGHRLVNNTSWHRNTTHSPRETRETKCLTNIRGLWWPGLDMIITLPVMSAIRRREGPDYEAWSIWSGSDQSIIIQRDAAEWMFVLFAGFLITSFPWA